MSKAKVARYVVTGGMAVAAIVGMVALITIARELHGF